MSVLLGGCQSTHSSAIPPAPRTQAERMAWWREARFGLFVHWGLYAIPAGEWKGSKGHGEWIRESAHIPLEDYVPLQQQFNPVNFNAREWARMAKAAGMQYVVITSKHHDGFGLWDSKVSAWDVGTTPFGRDILAELKQACEAEGLRFCTYHSIMDWHHPDYLPRRSWESRSEEGADFERYEDYLYAQVGELIANYRPAVMWFDGEWERTWNHERGVELFRFCRQNAPEMIVNNRVDVHRGGMGGFNQSSEAVGDFATPEQEIPATGVPGLDWETCMTMNDHWGYNALDAKWKSSTDLIRKLCDIASKGGNFLLNVGPRADGTFPPESVERLAELGEWMDVHGEAIHGTQTSPFENLEHGRATVRGSTLYLIGLDVPWGGEWRIPGLANEVHSCKVLGLKMGGEAASVPFRREGADLLLNLCMMPTNPHADVFRLELDGPPRVYCSPRISTPAPIFTGEQRVELFASAPELEVRWSIDGSAPARRGPLVLRESATVKAQCFLGDKPVSSIRSMPLKRVPLQPALPASGSSAGLWCRIFQGHYDRMPEFSTLAAAREHAVQGLGLPQGHAVENEVRQFVGFLDVPEEGVWEFALASDDGSLLHVDGELIVDHDGLHSPSEKRGFAALARGPHRLELGWFNAAGGSELSLKWRKAGGEAFAPIPSNLLSY
jgi:alpha-L-fucosidase